MIILYVDDDAEDAGIFCEAVWAVDPSVICKTLFDGQNIVKEISLECPDYIFLDFRMPIVDGIDILKQIKTLECFEKAKVIMYSTYMRSEDIEECRNLGVFDCWTKKSEFDLLCKDLAALIKGKI